MKTPSSQVRWLRQLSDPWVRLVDKIAGEAVVSATLLDWTGLDWTGLDWTGLQ